MSKNYSISYNELTNNCTVRVLRKRHRAYLIIKQVPGISYVKSNRLNHCLIFRGTIENFKNELSKLSEV